MMLANPTLPTLQSARQEICPSCGKPTVFHYLGEQRIPARLMRRNMPTAYTLWNCMRCHTTISEYAFSHR